MSRIKRIAKKLLHPSVIITAVIVLGPILFYVNGPGFRYLVPKLFESSGGTNAFTLKGTILGGYTIENVEGRFGDPIMGIREFEVIEMTPRINYLGLFNLRKMGWLKGLEVRGAKIELHPEELHWNESNFAFEPVELTNWGNLISAELDITSVEFAIEDLYLKDVSIKSKKGSKTADMLIGKIQGPKPVPLFHKVSVPITWDGKSKITLAANLPEFGLNFSSLSIEKKKSESFNTLSGVVDPGGGEVGFEFTTHLSMAINQPKGSQFDLGKIELLKKVKFVELAGIVNRWSFAIERKLPLQQLAWTMDGALSAEQLNIAFESDPVPAYVGAFNAKAEAVEIQIDDYDAGTLVLNTGKLTLGSPELVLHGKPFTDYQMTAEVTGFGDRIDFDAKITEADQEPREIAKGHYLQATQDVSADFQFGMPGPVLGILNYYFRYTDDFDFGGLVFGEVKTEGSLKDGELDSSYDLTFDKFKIDTGLPINGTIRGDRIIDSAAHGDMFRIKHVDLTCGDIKINGSGNLSDRPEGMTFESLNVLKAGEPCITAKGFIPNDVEDQSMDLVIRINNLTSHDWTRFFTTDFNNHAILSGDIELGGSPEETDMLANIQLEVVGNGEKHTDKLSNFLKDSMRYNPQLEMWITLPFKGHVKADFSNIETDDFNFTDGQLEFQSIGQLSIDGTEFESLRGTGEVKVKNDLDLDFELVKDDQASIAGLIRLDWHNGTIKENVSLNGEPKAVKQLLKTIQKTPYVRSLNKEQKEIYFKTVKALETK